MNIIRKILIKTYHFFKKSISSLFGMCHKKEKEFDLSKFKCTEIKDLNEIPIKDKGKPMKKKAFTHAEEVKGGKDSHKKENAMSKDKKMDKKKGK